MQFLPYSKQIIEHFKKPRNMGRIKNPCAVGEAGNLVCGDVMRIYLKIGERGGKKIIKDIKFETFGCLPPGEKVLVDNGDWEEISSLSETATILNSKGEKTKVQKIFVRWYEGPILQIVPFVSPYNSFFITPEHPVLCIKRKWVKSAKKSGKKCKWLRMDEKNLLATKPRYVKAKNLEEGDYLLFVVNREISDNNFFTKDMMKLIGFYLAKGYIHAEDRVVAFSFNKNERKLIEEVKFLLSEITGKKPKERTRKNVREVYICSRKLARLLSRVAGKTATKKKLSGEILLLPFEKQWEMISSHFKGDGYLHGRRLNDSPTYKIATASEYLAIQLQEILARGNIFASIKKIYNKPSVVEGRKIKASTLYSVEFKLQGKHRFVHNNGKYFLVPIRKVKEEYYKGYVYNLHVSNKPNSYLVRGFAVHNCIVAIANSSMLTTMVKGKTLEEVLKIKKEDLIKKLGKPLPPIKIHCSILALDALHEALYNYYIKNKLPIPEELKKEHRRIKETLSEIEHKHKEFIKVERKMLEK